MKDSYDLKSFFKKERIFNYVNKFAFPRLSGTDGEKRAVELVKSTFKDIGFKEDQLMAQAFNFSTFYSEVLIKILAFLTIVIYSLLIFIKYLYPFLTIIVIIIVGIIFLSILGALKHPEYQGFWEKYFGKWLSSTNIFLTLNAKSKSFENAGNIIISAHLDSKSQTFKTIWRVVFLTIWEIGMVVLPILYTFFLIDLYSHAIRTFILGIEFGIIFTTSFVLFSTFMILLNNTRNKSPGALDNASGMAIVFELSSLFKNNPLNNYNLWFCQFSAEEIGTMGSRIFLDSFEDIFSKKNTYQINFDMISCKEMKEVEYVKSYGFLPPKISSELLDGYIHQAAREENVPIKGFNGVSGAHTDSVPFHLRKFDSIDFATFNATKYAHSREDTPDKVNKDVLFHACVLVAKMLIDFDKETDNNEQ
jgi:putative aminopeptidase FrvX